MKAMNPNLQLNLNLSRKNSLINQNINSDLKTPIDQQIPNHFQFYPTGNNSNSANIMQTPAQTPVFRPCTERTDSINSLNSLNSDLDLTDLRFKRKPSSISNQSFKNNYLNNNSNLQQQTNPTPDLDFTSQFDEVLLNSYHTFTNNPSITPFDINYPPSGIVSKVSKITFKTIFSNNIPVLANPIENEEFKRNEQFWILSIFRKRLLELVNPPQPPFQQFQPIPNNLSRSNSNSSWLYANPSFTATRLSSTDSLIDSVPLSTKSIMNHHHQQQQQQQIQNSASTNLITPPQSSHNLNEYSKSNSTGSIDLNNQFSFEVSAPNTQPNNLSIKTAHLLQLQDKDIPLNSPFNENKFSFNNVAANNSVNPRSKRFNESFDNLNINSLDVEIDVDPHYNVTAQRKRDSLKLKRNMK